jgi:hypothetical protein
MQQITDRNPTVLFKTFKFVRILKLIFICPRTPQRLGLRLVYLQATVARVVMDLPENRSALKD